MKILSERARLMPHGTISNNGGLNGSTFHPVGEYFLQTFCRLFRRSLQNWVLSHWELWLDNFPSIDLPLPILSPVLYLLFSITSKTLPVHKTVIQPLFFGGGPKLWSQSFCFANLLHCSPLKPFVLCLEPSSPFVWSLHGWCLFIIKWNHFSWNVMSWKETILEMKVAPRMFISIITLFLFFYF